MKKYHFLNIYFLFDFEILNQIKKEDNYLLSKLIDKRISTFKTSSVNKYIDYLTDAEGWQ